MEHFDSFADERMMAACIFCGSQTESRDHCPSRVFLDQPYPENLPHVPSCNSCNAGFSLDEEYVACLIECARRGSIATVERDKIRRILNDSPALAARLLQARTVDDSGQVVFGIEHDRVKNVVLKLARGHAAFELSETLRSEPSAVMFAPIHLLNAQSRRAFEASSMDAGAGEFAPWPEVGSRAMQRTMVVGNVVFTPEWLEVQKGRYRYFATADSTVAIRFVIGEYLACEVAWGHE